MSLWSDVGSFVEKGVHEAELFGEGVISGAVLNPINKVEHVVNDVAGTHLPDLCFSNQKEVDHSFAGEAGNIAGTVLNPTSAAADLLAANHTVSHQVELFGEGVVTGAILNPINGVEQIVNHVAGTNLPPIEFTNQNEVNHSIAGQLGMATGMVADVVLTDGVAAPLMGVEAGSVASLAVTGAIQGGIFTPSDDTKTGGSFFLDRVENAGIQAATFATMGGVASRLSGLTGGFASTLPSRALASALTNGVGGAAAGVVSAEGNALKHGQFATVDELAGSVGRNALFGAGFGAASSVLGAVTSGRVVDRVNPSGDREAEVDPKVPLPPPPPHDSNTAPQPAPDGGANPNAESNDAAVVRSESNEVGIDDAAAALDSHRPATISIDSTQGRDEATELYNLMDQRLDHYTFVKTIYQADAVPVTDPGGIHVSTREQAIIAQQDIPLANGEILKAGSVLPNGTVYDGTTLRSAEPNSTLLKVYDQLLSTDSSRLTLTMDVTVDGTVIKAGTELPVGVNYEAATGLLRSTTASEFNITVPGEAGSAAQNVSVKNAKMLVPPDAITGGQPVGDVDLLNGTPADTATVRGGQTADGPTETEHNSIIVRHTRGIRGEEILDTYPVSPKDLAKFWKELPSGAYETNAVPRDGVVVPDNITIESKTPYGPVTINPGYIFRADGFGVSPKDLLETWNGYTNEAAYNFLMQRLQGAGLENSAFADLLKQQRQTVLAKQQ
jgi:hypothetical protein